jgi:hypothetical protein
MLNNIWNGIRYIKHEWMRWLRVTVYGESASTVTRIFETGIITFDDANNFNDKGRAEDSGLLMSKTTSIKWRWYVDAFGKEFPPRIRLLSCMCRFHRRAGKVLITKDNVAQQRNSWTF